MYTAGGINAGGIASVKIADGAIGTSKLSNSSVSTAKIGDLQVTTGKIANSAVTTAKLADSAVTPAKISDSGWQVLTAGVSYRKVGRIVCVTASKDSAAPKDSAVNLGTLPDGYRPSLIVYAPAQIGFREGRAYVTSAGLVSFYNSGEAVTKGTIVFTLLFPV